MVEISDQHCALRYKSVWKLLVALVVILFISWMVFTLQYQRQLNSLKLIQDNKVLSVHNALSRELGDLRKLVRLLAADQSLHIGATKLSYESKAEQIIRHLIDFGVAAQTISQIRWIDEHGQEQYRVNFSAGKHMVVEKSELQNKLNRYYFQQGIQFGADTVYISPIDLNVEHGQVVKPLQPTLRASIRTLPDEYWIDGVLVVNFDLTGIFNQLRMQSIPQAEIQLLNSQGFWLMHPQQKKEWGFLLGDNKLNLENENPDLWKKIQNLQDVEFDYFTGSEPISFLKMSIADPIIDQSHNDVVMLVSTNKESATGLFNSALLYTLIVALILCIITLVYIYKSYYYQREIFKGTLSLAHEKRELLAANKKLHRYIKQQKQLQDELIDAKKLSSLGLMVAGISHEMNTPLGGAVISISNAQVINQQLKEQIGLGLTKEFLDNSLIDIDENLALSRLNLDKAIAHIKGFKSMARDRAENLLVSCDINLTVDDLLRGLKSRFKASRVKINYKVAISKQIVSRPGIISQVIESLIVNALDHAFEKNAEGIIELNVFSINKDKLCITIADNGIGVDDSLRETIFEPFVTSSRGDGHTGLGLYLVEQWVCTILQGTIRLLNSYELDNGMTTQFEIIIPTKRKTLF